MPPLPPSRAAPAPPPPSLALTTHAAALATKTPRRRSPPPSAASPAGCAAAFSSQAPGPVVSRQGQPGVHFFSVILLILHALHARAGDREKPKSAQECLGQCGGHTFCSSPHRRAPIRQRLQMVSSQAGKMGQLKEMVPRRWQEIVDTAGKDGKDGRWNRQR